mmetsp:Transcript_55078/g.120079  ORF Transcript_55078/g.120079 Transcript_55078/m.120079 type:complete len:83 (+) Transcript_55078:524-772(+)
MGLGKTVMTLALIYKQPSLKKVNFRTPNCLKYCCDKVSCLKQEFGVPEKEKLIGGTLIVLPTSILDQWISEINSILGNKVRI